MASLCRDCFWPDNPEEAKRCHHCGSTRIIRHPELHQLSIAHIDCDSFFATVEKRDRPELKNKPVVIGGRHRGVVAAACYVARIYGVRSAMPMYKALQLCPDLVVLPPDKDKYDTVGQQVRALMRDVTPIIEPISIDEAFLDLSGTEALHHASPALSLIKLIKRIETEIGISASVGLSYNKFLAKIASDLDKPRGFAVIGQQDAMDFLENKPVSMIWGVGQAMEKRLLSDGVATIGQLRAYNERELMSEYGVIGQRLFRFCRGQDNRKVEPVSETKSISNETTMDEDIKDFAELKAILWPLCEKVAARLKQAEFAGETANLKLKTNGFQTISRSLKLQAPTQMAETLFRALVPILEKEANGRYFRLIGAGVSDLCEARFADPPDLFTKAMLGLNPAKIEMAMEAVRLKFGRSSIFKGRSSSRLMKKKTPRTDD